MKLPHILLTILLSAVTAYGVVQYAPTQQEAPTQEKKETAFERVRRTGTLRCGYLLWAPYLSQDLETKKMSGIAFDYMTAIAEELGLKIEWTEEVGWGNFQEGLKTNRYDAMCMPIYETGLRAKDILMTTSLYNDGLYICGREDDTRFDDSFDSINQPNISLALVEGEAVSTAVKTNIFPKSKAFYMPQMVDQGQAYMTIATRKADVGFTSPYNLNTYNKNNETKLKLLAGGKPVSVFGNSIAVRLGEYDLKFALDSAVHAVLKNGTAKRIIDAHKEEGFILPTGN